MGTDQSNAGASLAATIESLTKQAHLLLEYRLQCLENNLKRQMIDLKYGNGYRQMFIQKVINAVDAI